MEQLGERIRQEIEWAGQRPLEPMTPEPRVVMPSVPGESPAYAMPSRVIRLKQFLRGIPVLGDVLGTVNGWRRNPRLRERLRRLPLVGSGMAWVNAVRDLAGTRRRVAELAAQIAANQASQTVLANQTDERFRLASMHLAAHDGSLAELGRLLRMVDDGLNDERRGMEAQRQELAAVARQAQQQHSEIILVQRRLSHLLEAPPTVPAAPAGAATPASAVAPDALDALYTAFEGSFRGSRDEIKQRLSVYLERLDAAGLRDIGKPILDLGCGRGEWLELLGESHYQAYGIDLNAVNVARGTEAGFDMRQEDAIFHLRGLPTASLAAVTAFHLIEHLPFEPLVSLVDEALRVLAPGGVLILETPNPENLQVGAFTFYNDPTHRHPIPPAVARFLVESRGFAGAEILRLHPYPESERVAAESDLAQRFNQLFYGPQDYAVLGRKV